MKKVEVGKTYLITHSRKGTFLATIKKIDETWITALIVEGETEAIISSNVKGKGEEVQFRTKFLVNAVERP